MKLIIIGASGFGAEAAWILSRMPNAPRLAGFCDDDPAKAGGVFNGFPLLGNMERMEGEAPFSKLEGEAPTSRTKGMQGARLVGASPSNTTTFYFCAVGDNKARQTIIARANALGWTPFSIIDPTAVVAPDAMLGEGVFVGAHAVVSCGANVGKHTIINHNAVVGHNARVGGFVHICPGAKVSGFCNVGEGAFLATNATVIPSCNVGEWSLVGAGAVVLRDLPAHARLIPTPGRVLIE